MVTLRHLCFFESADSWMCLSKYKCLSNGSRHHRQELTFAWRSSTNRGFRETINQPRFLARQPAWNQQDTRAQSTSIQAFWYHHCFYLPFTFLHLNKTCIIETLVVCELVYAALIERGNPVHWLQCCLGYHWSTFLW